MEELWRQRSTLPKSALGKALTYLDNRWGPLSDCFDDPTSKISSLTP